MKAQNFFAKFLCCSQLAFTLQYNLSAILSELLIKLVWPAALQSASILRCSELPMEACSWCMYCSGLVLDTQHACTRIWCAHLSHSHGVGKVHNLGTKLPLLSFLLLAVQRKAGMAWLRCMTLLTTDAMKMQYFACCSINTIWCVEHLPPTVARDELYLHSSS